MLRPATPLTILLLAAFVLLLIAVISVPVVKTIPLASYGGVDFGVFGYCKGSVCSKVEIGYNTASLYTSDQTASFDLPVSTRATLSAILIVHPIAAFLTLVMLILAASAHFHSPSHSPRYLLGVFILSMLTLLVSLLAFLIDVLLFVPHLSWGSYLVLAATILILISSIVSCIMRRTLVSRKARRRRIAENAEMNGENFYNRQAQEVPAPLPPPIMTGASGVDKAPSFATFDMSNKEGAERTSDDRMPLTTRTPSNTSPEQLNARDGDIPLQERYGGPPRSNMNAPSGRFNGPPPRDEFGNPLPMPGPGMRSRDQSQDSQYRNPYPGPAYRGRGGQFRGRGGPGFQPGRGGYGPNGPSGRGSYGPGMNRGPPPSMNNGMEPMAAGAMGGMAAGAMMRGGRGGGPGYGYGPVNRRAPSPGGSYGPPGIRRGPSPGGSYGPYGRVPMEMPQGPPPYIGNTPQAEMPERGPLNFDPPQAHDSLPRAESPPPLEARNEGPHGMVGQAVEMDATTGSRSPSAMPAAFTQYGSLRDSDADVAGMVGLQQARTDLGRHPTVHSETSRYSNDEPYVPPRQQWTENSRPSPLAAQALPAELPSPVSQPHRRTTSGDHYYEDVDPRFAEPPEPEQAQFQTLASSSLLPSPLNNPGLSRDNGVGSGPRPNAYLHPTSDPNVAHSLQGANSYEDIQSGSRSPAESDRSNFTSVSQRGINPRWNPSMGPGGFGQPMSNSPMRRPIAPPTQRNDILLNSNPDFELPGMGARRGPPAPGAARGRPFSPAGMVPRSAYDNNGGI